MFKRSVGAALAAALALTGAARGQAENGHGPIGFLPGSRAAELRAEAQAIAVPSPEKAKAWLRALTEEPHVAGTPADYKTALDVRDKLRTWGWQAELAEYEVLLNYPIPSSVKLEVVRPGAQSLKVTEDPNPADKDSTSPEAFPAFHGYGVTGKAEGQVVYANYGRPEDFQTLERLGIDVKGKIVLTRYGELFRGLKVREAQKRGAIGLLIYSDPADDGYSRGDIYPTGPYRPASALQRGSVMFLSLGPGDPSTPFGPSTKDAKRLPIDRYNGFTTSTKAEGPMMGRPEPIMAIADWEKQSGLKRADYFSMIPSLPISYESAQPILEALGGPNVPSGWQGALPLPYHTGPGPAEVRFSITMDYKLRKIWNVIGTIKGTVEPDRWILVGNHRDAWVYGAVDPSSGTAATLEMCRALGEAVKNGWKPRRTLVYASWDAEEYGLVGSTEWGEDHAQELDAKAALMLNVDSAVGGQELDLSGVPSLRDFVLEAAGTIPDVTTGRPLREVWLRHQRSGWAANGPIDLDPLVWKGNGNGNGNGSASSDSHQARFVPQMSALGSGSDYTVFLDHLGVPCVDIGFKGRYGVYHSIYDDFYWMEKFCDPEFVRHAAAAKLYTVVAMRAAGAEVLPLKFMPYGEALRDQVDDLRRLVERKARSAEPNGGKTFAFEGLPGLIAAVLRFQAQAAALDRATEALASKDGADAARLARTNDALQRIERAFLSQAGLPARPWFKHMVYAPGLTTGYACWTFPGVRQAIIQNDPKLLAEQLPILIQRIDAATAAMRTATEAAGDSAARAGQAGGRRRG